MGVDEKRTEKNNYKWLNLGWGKIVKGDYREDYLSRYLGRGV